MERFRFGKKMPKRQKGESEADYQKRVKAYIDSIRPKLPNQEGK